MKTKVLAMMLLAGGSMFAQSRFSNGLRNGSFGSADDAPVASSRYINPAHVQPRFNSYSNNAYSQQGFEGGFTQGRNRFDGQNRNHNFAPVQNRDNRENSRGLSEGVSGDRDEDGFRGR